MTVREMREYLASLPDDAELVTAANKLPDRPTFVKASRVTQLTAHERLELSGRFYEHYRGGDGKEIVFEIG